MTNINKISLSNYRFLTVFSALTAMYIYRATIFRCLFLHTLGDSKIFLWFLWAICLAVTYLLTYKRRRNFFSVFSNTVIPFGIYTMITYDTHHPHIIFIVQIALILGCGIYAMLHVLTDIPDESELSKVIKRRFFHFLGGAKSIASVCLSVLVIYVSALYFFDSPSLVPAVKPAVTVQENKTEYLNKNLPVISNIDSSVWSSLSLEDRTDTLQTLANVTASQLGISHEIIVRVASLGMTYGCYDFNRHTVTINKDIVENNDPRKCVETVCHETRHAFQHDVADAYLSLDKEYQQLEIFNTVRQYYENLDDYKNVASNGFEEYETQLVERDCRAYSEVKTDAYFTLAREYHQSAKKK